MGLNIGIKVKKQPDGYYDCGCNPKGTIEELKERFECFLTKKFPLGGFGVMDVYYKDEEYDFDIRMFNYGKKFGEYYPNADMYLAITEFIYNEFSHIEGINLETYWSG